MITYVILYIGGMCNVKRLEFDTLPRGGVWNRVWINQPIKSTGFPVQSINVELLVAMNRMTRYALVLDRGPSSWVTSFGLVAQVGAT